MAETPLFVTCPRGMEALLAAELENLGGAAPRQKAGGVATAAETADIYRICLWSRLASRVLLPLVQFETPDADALYNAARAINWPELFAPQRSFSIQVAGRSAAFDNSHFAALRTKDAIVDCFRAAELQRPSVDTHQADIRIHLHLGNPSTLSLDLSGESLHRRGYRKAGSAAPLKENLACALLMRCG
ncbi:MAG: THUMP domain-containing protein, partial [Sinobacteraceae bacterium]|nr:THUMP domain-containing protein [Nevskiaceae bacterium]